MDSEITKNMVNGVVNDNTTTYTIADATKHWTTHFSNKNNWSLQIVWAGLTGTLDGTIQLQGSNNGVNFDNLPNNSSLVLNSANDSDSFRKDKYDFKYFRVLFIKNNLNNAGTLKILLNIKI